MFIILVGNFCFYTEGKKGWKYGEEFCFLVLYHPFIVKVKISSQNNKHFSILYSVLNVNS